MTGMADKECEHVPNIDISYFRLTCDVIGGKPEVSKIWFRSTSFAGLSLYAI